MITKRKLISINLIKGELNKHKVIISDNGKGMDGETKQRIFDPFFTSDLGIGSGLGMYIVHNLVVNQLVGAIEISSEKNKGTTITVKFPV